MRIFLVFVVGLMFGIGRLQAQAHGPGVSVDERIANDRLKARVLGISSDIPLRYNRRIRDFIHYFAYQRRDYIQRVQNRASLYFPIFEDALARHRLPQALKYLPIVESALQPQARSRSGAVGLWQFMPATGRMMGLKQNAYIDDRRDPYKATEAACLYLKSLYRRFGDWELVLAAFNAGPGHVSRAIRRSGHKSYWRIGRYLSRETRAYVPQFMAIMYVMNYAPHHNLMPTKPRYLSRWDTLRVREVVDLKTLAQAMHLCPEALYELNLRFIRQLVPKNSQGYVIRIPASSTSIAESEQKKWLAQAQKAGQALLKKIQQQVYADKRKIYYRIQKGDVLGTIAERYHVRIYDIKRWNRLRSSRIIAGKKLVLWVPTTPQPQRSYRMAAAQKSNTSARYHIVRRGDTLWDIAMKYKGLTIAEIRRLNRMGSRANLITPGQKIRITP